MKPLLIAARNGHRAIQSATSGGQVLGLIAAILSLWPIQVVPADLALQTLYEFKSNPKNPRSDLVQGNDGNFYGTTGLGGTNGENGTVFQITPGGAFTVLHAFQGVDGALPLAGLVQAVDGFFYGATQVGGTNGDLGTVFRIATNGEFLVLHHFGGPDGRHPQAALIPGNDGYFYGTTALGGTNGDQGTVFRITPNGKLTSLFSFNGTNGSRPLARLALGSDGNFYGTTSAGGPAYDGINVFGHGTVFRIAPDGTMTTLVSFSGTDGSSPEAGLTEGADGSFYGTTQSGGARGDNGTVFKITPAGTLTSLYSFAGPDGNYPVAGLIAGDNSSFYGTTSGDRSFAGTNTFGTIFRLAPDGGLTTLLSFKGTDGASPLAGLIRGNDGNLYGSTFEGGANGDGTLFRLVERPFIASIAASADSVRFTWTSFIGGTYRLEYKAALTETSWTALNPDVTATQDQTSMTYLLAGAPQSFFRIRLLP